MMSKRRIIKVFIVAYLISIPLTTNAKLWDRGDGLIYDDELDITWLQDANYALTSGYIGNLGRMTWQQAMAWAEQLEYEGFDDWRLPTALGPNGEYPGLVYNGLGEMAHLYYTTLGNTFGGGEKNYEPFINVTGYWYWTSTEHNESLAWYLQLGNGSQNTDPKTMPFNAWAVRDGDVTAFVDPIDDPVEKEPEPIEEPVQEEPIEEEPVEVPIEDTPIKDTIIEEPIYETIEEPIENPPIQPSGGGGDGGGGCFISSLQ